MRLCCFDCGKVCSSEVPDSTVLRGVVTCSECIEAQTPKCTYCGKEIASGCGIQKTGESLIPLCSSCSVKYTLVAHDEVE